MEGGGLSVAARTCTADGTSGSRRSRLFLGPVERPPAPTLLMVLGCTRDTRFMDTCNESMCTGRISIRVIIYQYFRVLGVWVGWGLPCDTPVVIVESETSVHNHPGYPTQYISKQQHAKQFMTSLSISCVLEIIAVYTGPQKMGKKEHTDLVSVMLHESFLLEFVNVSCTVLNIEAAFPSEGWRCCRCTPYPDIENFVVLGPSSGTDCIARSACNPLLQGFINCRFGFTSPGSGSTVRPTVGGSAPGPPVDNS